MTRIVKSGKKGPPRASSSTVGTRAVMIGKRVRALRLELGLSVEEVAQAMGSTKSSLWNIEAGRQLPSLNRFIRLAQILRVDELDLTVFPGAHVRHDLVEATRTAPLSTVIWLLDHLREHLDAGRGAEEEARTKRAIARGIRKRRKARTKVPRR